MNKLIFTFVGIFLAVVTLNSMAALFESPKKPPYCDRCSLVDCPKIWVGEEYRTLCPVGIATDNCDCCPACRKNLGEPCGGEYDEHGRCGLQFFCYSRWGRSSPGHCVRLSELKDYDAMPPNCPDCIPLVCPNVALCAEIDEYAESYNFCVMIRDSQFFCFSIFDTSVPEYYILKEYLEE